MLHGKATLKADIIKGFVIERDSPIPPTDRYVKARVSENTPGNAAAVPPATGLRIWLKETAVATTTPPTITCSRNVVAENFCLVPITYGSISWALKMKKVAEKTKTTATTEKRKLRS